MNPGRLVNLRPGAGRDEQRLAGLYDGALHHALGRVLGPGAQFVIQALDAQSFDFFLRNGGAKKIQSALNVQTGRYSGVGLGTT